MRDLNCQVFQASWKRFFVIVTLVALEFLSEKPSFAYIPTCNIHNGMKIWYLDYAENDYSLSHPLGVREGIVEINEIPWHSKCKQDAPETKVYVPFIPISGRDRGQMDTRWPQGVYLSKDDAERAYRHSL